MALQMKVSMIPALFHLLLRNSCAIFYIAFPKKLDINFQSERLKIQKVLGTENK